MKEQLSKMSTVSAAAAVAAATTTSTRSRESDSVVKQQQQQQSVDTVTLTASSSGGVSRFSSSRRSACPSLSSNTSFGPARRSSFLPSRTSVTSQSASTYGHSPSNLQSYVTGSPGAPGRPSPFTTGPTVRSLIQTIENQVCSASDYIASD